jgi:hypothetical protein
MLTQRDLYVGYALLITRSGAAWWAEQSVCEKAVMREFVQSQLMQCTVCAVHLERYALDL